MVTNLKPCKDCDGNTTPWEYRKPDRKVPPCQRCRGSGLEPADGEGLDAKEAWMLGWTLAVNRKGLPRHLRSKQNPLRTWYTSGYSCGRTARTSAESQAQEVYTQNLGQNLHDRVEN